MYLFNSNDNNSISCTTQARPLLNIEIDPETKPQDPHSSYYSFHFPSPNNYIHYEDDSIFLQHFHDLFHQQQPDNIVAEAVTNMANSSNSDSHGLKEESNKKCGYVADQPIPRKRPSKKDRHSKINTVHGPRDRRMRLSLEVARKFFGLQDVLGFDKASRTVEWLLKSSKTAIKELTRGFPQMNHHSSVGANSASSTSECEVLSGIDESVVQGNQQATKAKPSSCTKEKEKKVRGFRKIAFDPLAKESREKARARARERTREKQRLVESNLRMESMNHDLNRLGSWSPFAAREEPVAQTHNMNPSSQLLAREDIVADSLLITGNWTTPSTIFNYQNNYAGISHEHQFTDFCGKPWEAYNN